MIADMLGNQIGAGVGSIPDFIENHKAGKIRVIAVMGKYRQAALPEVPTFEELGVKGFDEVPYYGLFAPAGTPQTEIVRMSDALLKVLTHAEVRGRLAAMGLNVGFMPQRQFSNREQAYTQAWTWIIKTSGFQPQ
jgi:tripartite-type tricarboxylate transporter receptor subunit TctC